MTRSKAAAVLTLLLLAPLLSRAQSAPSPSPTASTEESFVGPFYWGKSGDVETWLKAHESFLRRGDGCSLLVSWSGKGPGYGSANHNVAEFMIAPGDDYLSTIIHDSTSPSGLDIRVGAKYFPAGGGKEELEIALAFEGAPDDDVFSEITAVEASTIRDKDWKVLGLEREIEIGDLRYRYSLFCENGKRFMSFLRKPHKHHRHSS